MGKAKTDSFILELKLNTTKKDEDILNKRFEIARKMYNSTLSFALKNLSLMRESKKYRALIKEYRVSNGVKKKEISTALSKLKSDHKLNEYDLHAYIKKHQHNYKSHIDSLTAQAIASKVSTSINDILYGKGKKAHFKKYGSIFSIEGKTNSSGMRFVNNKLEFLGLSIPVVIRKNDIFAHEALTKRVKYVRICKRASNTKDKFYLQLILEGTVPVKRVNSTGAFRHYFSTGRVGIDIGTSTIAIASDSKCILKELAKDSTKYEKEIANLKRKLDRSRRSTNKDNFNVNGTVKKGKLKWVKSNNYMKTIFKIKRLYALKSAYIKNSHSKLSNEILSLGDEIYVEDMDFKSLSKKKKLSKNKNGKFKSRKNFGKSAQNKAPAKLLKIIDRKLKYQNKELLKVNTKTFKASQYHHDSNLYIKEPLSKRYKEIEGFKVQRDLYSAFLLKNSKKNLKQTNRDLCINGFNDFLYYHNLEINQILKSKEKTPKSFGILELI